MHLQSLTKFLSLVTPERLEEYLREKGWAKIDEEKDGQGLRSRVWECRRPELAERDRPAILIAHRQSFGDYRRRHQEAIRELAEHEDRHELSVLFDLLPPEHRQELVKAVFPGLEAKGRPETGPMRFGNDWSGLFIRGDNAAAYAMALESLLRRSALTLPEALLNGLLDDLKSTNEQDPRPRQKAMLLEALPEMTACEECDTIFPEGTTCPECAALLARGEGR